MRRTFVLTFCCCLIVQLGFATYPMDYLTQFRKIFSDNSLHYDMQCIYPDSSSLHIKGVVAIQGNKYYDSSNIRYILYNDDWYIAADHINQLVSATYLPNLKKETKGLGTLAISSFLYGDDFFSQHVKIRKEKEIKDTVWMQVKLDEDTIIRSMVVKLLKGSLVPLGYELTLRCPVNRYGLSYADEDPSAVVYVQMRCYDISYPASPAFFRADNIIQIAGGKATLKRYRNYKTYSGHF